MNILVDAMSSRAGGGRTYLRNVLAHDPPFADMRVSVLAPPSLDLPKLGRGIERIVVDERYARPLARMAWERTALPKYTERLRADAVFFPGGTVPRSIARRHTTVTMARNMLPFDHVERARYPLGYVRARITLLEPVMVRSMLAADLVIFVSDYARDVLAKRCQGRLMRDVVIRHGVGDEFRDAPSTVRLPWLPDEYLVYVSNIEPYKCQLELVRAFYLLRQLRGGDEKLLLVGPESSAFYTKQVKEEIQKLGLSSQVTLTGGVPHEDLPAVYRDARLVVFPSACENCPNALLEGMAAGRPLLVSNRPPMPEFGRDAVVYADPFDPAGMASQMRTLLEDAGLQADLGRRARDRGDDFRWSEVAAKTWTAIADLAGSAAGASPNRGQPPVSTPAPGAGSGAG